MVIKKLMPTVFFKKSLLLSLSFFVILSGCKGRQEKQPVTALSPAEQQQSIEPVSLLSASPTTGAESVSTAVVADTPPSITSLKIFPENPMVGDKIKALVETSDKDGNFITLMFHWSINGVELSEKYDTLSGGFKRADKISLTVVPDNGKRTGNPKSLTIIVGNANPSMQSPVSSHSFNGSEYSFQVKAVDPDGDPVTYSLKSSPEGMSIDPLTGLVKWNVPADYNGKFPYMVSVTDGLGGVVTQEYFVEISRGRKEVKRL
jgi:hypothetical protein